MSLRPSSAAVLLLLIAVSVSSCALFRRAPELPRIVESVYLPAPDAITLDTVVAFAPDTISQTHLLATLEKTYCYGQCPEYKLEIYSNGQLVYRGLGKSPLLGDYVAVVDSATVRTVTRLAEAADYFRLAPYYPTQGTIINELPVTVTSVDLIYKQHRVTNAHGSPTALHRLERYLEDLALRQDWLPATEH